MFKEVEEHTKIKAMKHGSLAKQFPRQIMMALYLLHGNSREGKELRVGKKRTVTGNSGIEKFKPKYLGGEKLPDGEIYYTAE